VIPKNLMYRQRKEELRAERNAAGEAFETWRKCAECKPLMGYCSEHRAALDRYQAAQRALRAHIEGTGAL
jgi:hypothetical protein